MTALAGGDAAAREAPAGQDPPSGPKVSALVPVWNSAEQALELLDALAAQTWPNLEILVGDDASPDGRTPELLRAWAEGRGNVVLILREDNLGWVGNYNDLMQRASGDFVFFAGHDDLVPPGYVARLVRAAQDAPDAARVYGDHLLPEDPGQLLNPARDGAEKWLDADYRVMNFAPQPLTLRSAGGPPHIRLDHAAQFLLGDRL